MVFLEAYLLPRATSSPVHIPSCLLWIDQNKLDIAGFHCALAARAMNENGVGKVKQILSLRHCRYLKQELANPFLPQSPPRVIWEAPENRGRVQAGGTLQMGRSLSAQVGG